MHILKWDLENLPSEEKKQEIVDFLYHNLEEYGDEKKIFIIVYNTRLMN